MKAEDILEIREYILRHLQELQADFEELSNEELIECREWKNARNKYVHGLANKNPFSSFKLRFENTERGYLTMEELSFLMNKKITSKRLEQIRDVFVFSCFTGLAYCDAQALTAEHIINGPNNRPWLRTHRKKTSTPVDVPLLEVPLQILAKYEGYNANGK